MGWFSSGDKVHCSNCGKDTNQTAQDCWDADEDDERHRRWSDKLNCMLYRRITYFTCNNCGARNTRDSWHP